VHASARPPTAPCIYRQAPVNPKCYGVKFLRAPRSKTFAVTGLVLLRAHVALAQRGQGPSAAPLPVPMTALDDRVLASDLDNRPFTLTFSQPVPVRDLLLLLVRGTSLSMVPDPEIAGSFIGELKNISVRQALGLILPPLGLDYSVNGSFIRVFRREAETRIFYVNYIATERSATVNTGGGPDALSSARLTSTTSTDLFSELAAGVKALLSDRATFNLDRKAGLLQVTDLPERLDRVQTYLDAVSERVHREVEIDARILEVELSDPDASSIDFAALLPGAGTQVGGASSRRMLSGLGPGDVSRFLTALAGQGKVSMIGDPHILTLNNEPALVRAVSNRGTSEEEGVTLAVTPQIGAEGVVMLSLSPIVAQQVGAGTDKTPPTTNIRETDTLARIADGGTIVLAGFTRERETREQRNAGIKGGWFGRSTVVTKKRIELVIMLTPRVVGGVETQ